MFPDPEPHFVRHPNGGLQRKQDLATVMRLVRDELPQQDDTGPLLDTLPPLGDSRKASLNCRARRSKRRNQFRSIGRGAGLKSGNSFQEIAPDMRHTDRVQVRKHLRNRSSR